MNGTRFRFGLFELDAAKRELRREGVLVRLQAQPAQVLACLVERAGEVVSREELRQAIWGDGTFVDFDAGLNFCISQLRAALGDEAAQPLYIRTIPKSGYQFIAPVERVGGNEADSSRRTANSKSRVEQAVTEGSAVGAAGGPLAARRGKVSILVWATGVAAALVTLGLGGLALTRHWYSKPSGIVRAPLLAVARFDNETGDATMVRVSDGLTDDVVEQLTARGGGAYRVIGNAQILRLPREQRDLKAIGASLGAGYVVLGQVQANGAQVRILAHLIRLSDQTHIWVVRLDRPRGDELQMEAEAAAQIGTELAARMAQQPERAGSFAPGSH